MQLGRGDVAIKAGNHASQRTASTSAVGSTRKAGDDAPSGPKPLPSGVTKTKITELETSY